MSIYELQIKVVHLQDASPLRGPRPPQACVQDAKCAKWEGGGGILFGKAWINQPTSRRLCTAEEEHTCAKMQTNTYINSFMLLCIDKKNGGDLSYH